jgi:hypothetical protein
MARLFIHSVVALAFMGAGWAAARAQASSADFEFVVTAPVGETRIECVRGCTLAWVERGTPNGSDDPTFWFSCSGAATRCSSGRVGGWNTR